MVSFSQHPPSTLSLHNTNQEDYPQPSLSNGEETSRWISTFSRVHWYFLKVAILLTENTRGIGRARLMGDSQKQKRETGVIPINIQTLVNWAESLNKNPQQHLDTALQTHPSRKLSQLLCPNAEHRWQLCLIVGHGLQPLPTETQPVAPLNLEAQPFSHLNTELKQGINLTSSPGQQPHPTTEMDMQIHEPQSLPN